MRERIIFVAEYPVYEKHWIEEVMTEYHYDYLLIDDKSYNIEDYKKSYGRILYWKKYLKLAIKTIKASNENDVIVSLTFSVGLIIALVSKLIRKTRKVIALNLIAYDNSKLDFIKIPLFRYAFLKCNLKSTVNANEYINKFNKKFKLNNKNVFYILNDPINPLLLDSSNSTNSTNDSYNYCFSGGEANRDWNTLLDVAKTNQHINFKITAREYMWKNKKKFNNVEVAFDEKLDDFIKKLKQSKIVVIPLANDMVAGLTVFIQAIALKKFVLVTDIPATRVYVPDDCKDILLNIHDKKDLSEKLNFFYDNEEKKDEIINSMYNNLLENFSEKKYVEKIIEITEIAFNNK